MKYIASFLFAAALTVAGTVTPAAGQSLDSGQAPQEGDPHSADVLLAHRPKATPAAETKSASGKKEPLTASLAKDEQGKSLSAVYAPADKIYLLWKDPSAAKGDKVRVAWYAEETGKVFPKNKKLSEGTQTLPGPGSFGTSIAPSVKGALPVGKYRVEVYNNDKLAASVKFTVGS